MHKSNNQTVYKIRLKKGDKVIVRSGKYKGQTGTVLHTHPKDNTVTVEGINIIKKHLKPNREHPQGGIIEFTKPISVSKVGYYDSEQKRAARIGYSENKKGEKIRVLRPSGKEIA